LTKLILKKGETGSSGGERSSQRSQKKNSNYNGKGHIMILRGKKKVGQISKERIQTTSRKTEHKVLLGKEGKGKRYCRPKENWARGVRNFKPRICAQEKRVTAKQSDTGELGGNLGGQISQTILGKKE